MIFIEKETASIWIPRHSNHEGVDMKLTLVHNLTGTEYEFNSLTNIGVTTNYWVFTNLDFTNLQSGEYNYNLSDLETGLLCVNSDTTESIDYNIKKTTIQYGS